MKSKTITEMDPAISQNLVKKIDDPLITDWALCRLEDLRKKKSEEAKKFESKIFNEPVLRRIIDCRDSFVLTDLFRTLRERAELK